MPSTRFDLGASDCVVFTERALAMALSRNWREFYLISERLRHRDGVVAYENRNFCTLSEWVPNNAWLLQDITEELVVDGVRVAEYFRFNVREPIFESDQVPGSRFKRTVFKGYDFNSPPRAVLNIPYIPRKRVPDILPQLAAGDVCLVIRSYLQPRMMPWFDCDHMGLVVRGPDGSLNLLHSAPPSVQREGIVRFLQKFPHVAGFRFLRIRPNAVATSDLEINRLHDSIQVPEAAVQDVRNASLRQERIGPVIEQQ